MPSGAYEHSHLEGRHRANPVSVENNAACSLACNGGFKEVNWSLNTPRSNIIYLVPLFLQFTFFLEFYPQLKRPFEFAQLLIRLECPTPLYKILLRFQKAQV